MRLPPEAIAGRAIECTRNVRDPGEESRAKAALTAIAPRQASPRARSRGHPLPASSAALPRRRRVTTTHAHAGRVWSRQREDCLSGDPTAQAAAGCAISARVRAGVRSVAALRRRSDRGGRGLRPSSRGVRAGRRPRRSRSVVAQAVDRAQRRGGLRRDQRRDHADHHRDRRRRAATSSGWTSIGRRSIR